MQFCHASKFLFHGRYRDDDFIIFNGTIQEIEDFFYIGNPCHKHLQFTFEVSPSSVNFLDTCTTVYKGTDFKTLTSMQQVIYQTYKLLSITTLIANLCSKDSLKENASDMQEILPTTQFWTLCSMISRRIVKARLLFPWDWLDPIIKETINTNQTKLILNGTPKQALHNPTVVVTKFNPCLLVLAYF